MINTNVTATQYSLVQTKEAVILITRWMDDAPDNRANWSPEEAVSCWTEIDREPFVKGEEANNAWRRLKVRNAHILPMRKRQAG